MDASTSSSREQSAVRGQLELKLVTRIQVDLDPRKAISGSASNVMWKGDSGLRVRRVVLEDPSRSDCESPTHKNVYSSSSSGIVQVKRSIAEQTAPLI